MAESGVISIGVVAEATADRETACVLADRVMLSGVDWLTEDILPANRTYCGVDNNLEFLPWTKVKVHASAAKITLHGKFAGEPGAPDAFAARLALTLFVDSSPEAVLLIRDTDNQPERRRGLEQARHEKPWPFKVVIGAADSKRECWVLCGFDPDDAPESILLDQMRAELGFDPRERSEQLTAQPAEAKRSAKRVLAVLTRQDIDRQKRCVRDTSIDLLKQRGTNNGLKVYLEEVEAEVLPLLRRGQG